MRPFLSLQVWAMHGRTGQEVALKEGGFESLFLFLLLIVSDVPDHSLSSVSVAQYSPLTAPPKPCTVSFVPPPPLLPLPNLIIASQHVLAPSNGLVAENPPFARPLTIPTGLTSPYPSFLPFHLFL